MEEVVLPAQTIKLLLKKHKDLLEAVPLKNRKRKSIREKVRVEYRTQSDKFTVKGNS